MSTSFLAGWALVLVLLAAAETGADPVPSTGIGSAAPTWDGVRWVSGAPATGLQPVSFRGRVLAILFFPGDREDGLAAWGEVTRAYAGAADVAFVALHASGPGAEGAATPESGAALLARHGIAVPHGLLPGAPRAVGKMPWTVVVDRAGVVRSEGPVRDAARLRLEIESLRAWSGAANPLVGQAFGRLDGLRWLTPDGRPFAFASRPLTLLRWWTNQCPFCLDSIPALARLEQKHAARGLRLVAVYHPKGRRLSDEAARAYGQRLGFAGALAFDDRWTKFLELQQRGNLRVATSISVLVDADGIVRWVHLGPRIHESTDPRHAQAAADLAALDRLLDRLLPPAAPQR